MEKKKEKRKQWRGMGVDIACREQVYNKVMLRHAPDLERRRGGSGGSGLRGVRYHVLINPSNEQETNKPQSGLIATLYNNIIVS